MPAGKLLLFDFDGTLVDTLKPIIAIVNREAPKYGIRTIRPEEVDALRNMSIKELLDFFKIPLIRMPFFIGKIRGELFHDMAGLRFNRGVEPVLPVLKELGFTLAVVTSNSKENVDRFLKTKQADIFESVYSNMNIFGKAGTLRSILLSKKIGPDEAVYIGDEVRDIEACKSVGIPVVAVGWGFNTPELLKKAEPDALITEPAKLIDTIVNLA